MQFRLHTSLCHPCSTVQPEWHRSSVQGWPRLHRHLTLDPDKSWPLHIRDRWNAVTRCQKLHSVCMCVSVCVFVRETTLACEVRAVLVNKLRLQQLSQVPVRQMGKSDCLSQINTVKKTCTHKHEHMVTAARRLRWEGSWIITFSDVHQLSILTSDLILPRHHPPSDQKGARHRSITATYILTYSTRSLGHCSDAL